MKSGPHLAKNDFHCSTRCIHLRCKSHNVTTSGLNILLIPPENVDRTKTEFLNRCSLKKNNNYLL